MRDGDELFQEAYKELRKLANGYVARERWQTLQPTELVHEVYLRLAKSGPSLEGAGDSRAYFFGAIVRAMRRTLIDLARKKQAVKHGAGMERVEGLVTIPDVRGDRVLSAEELLTLDRALVRFEELYADEAEVVQLRYFGGLQVREIAELRGVSTRTIERDWAFAKAWLQKAMTEDGESDG